MGNKCNYCESELIFVCKFINQVRYKDINGKELEGQFTTQEAKTIIYDYGILFQCPKCKLLKSVDMEDLK